MWFFLRFFLWSGDRILTTIYISPQMAVNFSGGLVISLLMGEISVLWRTGSVSIYLITYAK